MKQKSIAPSKNKGSVLFIALIMLVLITLVAVAAIRMSTTNLQLVNNEQFRAEAQTVASYALNEALNREEFFSNTTSTTTTVSLTTDNPLDDTKAFNVTASKPECVRYGYIKKSELIQADNTVLAEDVVCITGQSSNNITISDASVIGDPNENSLCADALFDIEVEVNDEATGANLVMAQGVSMRMDISEAENQCE